MDNELTRNTYTTESSLRKDQNLTDHEYADRREMKKEGDVKTEDDAAGAYGLTPNRLVVGSGHKKRYQCSICNALFSQSWNCISHMQAHTRIRPDFNCEVCGKKCCKKSELEIHMRIHTGEKPYTCGECGKKFVRQGQLKEHSRCHTGERPFMCNLCGVTFTCSSNLRRHDRLHSQGRSGGTPRMRRSAQQCKALFESTSQQADKMNERHVRDENGTREPVPTLHADGRSEGSTPFDFTQKVLKSAGNQSSHNADIVTRTTKTDLQRQSVRATRSKATTSFTTRPHIIVTQSKRAAHDSSHSCMFIQPALSEVSVTSSAAPLTSFDIPMAIAETRKLADVSVASLVNPAENDSGLQSQVDTSMALSAQQMQIDSSATVSQQHILADTNGSVPLSQQLGSFVAVSQPQIQVNSCMSSLQQGQTDSNMSVSHEQAQFDTDSSMSVSHQQAQSDRLTTVAYQQAQTDSAMAVSDLQAQIDTDTRLPQQHQAQADTDSAMAVSYQQAPIGTDTGMSQAENHVIVTMENSTAEVMSEARDSAQEVINIRPEESATTSVPMDLTALFEELSASIQSQATGKKAPAEFGQVPSAPTGPVTITVSLPSARVSAGEKITIPIEQLLAATSELQQQDQSATSDQVINIHVSDNAPFTVLLEDPYPPNKIVRDGEETANLTTSHSNKQHILLQPDADGQICIQAANNIEPVLLAENGLSQNASGNDQKPQKEKLWPCDICGVRFSRNWYLTVHRRTHFRQTSFPCDVCGVEFPRVGNLNRHRRVHTGEKPFPCSNCDATFSTKYRLIEHLRRHAGIKLYKCDVCGGGFTDSSGLRRHKRSHKGDNLPFTCEVCGAGFNTSHSLTTHLRSHSGEEGCEGPGIELDAKEPTALKMPVITAEKAKEEGTPNTPCVLVHTDPASGTSSYKCSECPRSFKFAAACRQHIMHHTGSRPFKCRHCGAKFARKADAKRHTVIHTRRKSHECSKCGEQFLSKAKLALHAEDHLDLSEKTHKCDLCPKVFSTPSVLRSHHKMHSRKDSLKHDANLHKDGDSISEKRTVNTKVCDQPQNGVCVRISVDFAASTDKTETRAADELSGEKNGACAVNISPVADPLAFMTEQHHVVEEINAIQAEEALKQTKGKKKRKRASSDWEDETETKISAPTKQTSDPVPRRRPQRQASKKLQQLIAAVTELETNEEGETIGTMEESAGLPTNTVCEDADGDNNTLQMNEKIQSSSISPDSGLKKPKYSCSACGKGFLTRPKLRSHRQGHKRHPTFHCDRCPTSFVRENELAAHSKLHSAVVFPCGMCETQLSSKKALVTHQQTHNGTDRPCPKCHSTFSTANSLRFHLQHYHGRRFECDYCEEFLKTRASLKQHVQSHKPILNPLKDGTTTDSDLPPTSHASNTADPTKQLQTPDEADSYGGLTCFKQVEELQRCLATQGGVFRCNVCKKAQDSKDKLTEHLKTHHQCPECGIAYQHACQLSLHMRTHTGERPFKCDVCGHAFAKRTQLKVHLHRHGGQKLLKCDQCGALFSRLSYLAHHKKMH